MLPSPCATRLLFVLGLLLLGACNTEEYERQRAAAVAARDARPKAAPLSKREQRSAQIAAAVGGGGSNLQIMTRGAASQLARSELPFTRIPGYVVRGTDESSFKACGVAGVHFLRLGPNAAAQLVQRYRFRATKPFSPVYFVLLARILKDTVTVGENVYDSVIEVDEVVPEVDGEQPDCPAPRRGSLIATRD